MAPAVPKYPPEVLAQFAVQFAATHTPNKCGRGDGGSGPTSGQGVFIPLLATAT